MRLEGRTAIVTGAASGIGVETARALAEAGADVLLAVRNTDAGQAVADDINRAGQGRASVGRLDLSDLGSVAGFASAWGDKPLNILINNAGVMACPLSYTAQDLETQIGTNHFGHFLLSALLARALMNGADEGRTSRLVSLSSIGHARSMCGYASTFMAGASSTSQSRKNARHAARFTSRFPFHAM